MRRRPLSTPDIPSGEKAYCGCFSLMAITGKTLEQARRTIRRANGWDKSRRIKGLSTSALYNAFNYCGVKISTVESWPWFGIDKRNAPTLRRWIESRKGEDIHRCFVVNITGHYVVIHGYQFIDTFTNVAVRYEDAPHLRKKVEKVFLISG